ncbi:hypothetical protein [Caldalkalibacillus mannanilyticus]|uniref:hypothetical protein n=1 Tax=Caldalkalibacillus mannanilyticus TaxID=1418 RepID=UPI0004698727|nr:hypothetical protein [Caldalkalibacillus mannanilyticus]
MSELPFPFKRTASSYDQEYITGLPEGNALVSQVLQLKKNHYLLHVGLFDLNHEEYTFDYEVSFDYPVYVDKTILISPSGKQAAMRVIGYTLEGEPQQTLILFDLETVSELLSPLEVGAYYDTFEWKDDHTIIVQGEEISISSVKK